jgi:hypothetical protein
VQVVVVDLMVVLAVADRLIQAVAVVAHLMVLLAQEAQA